jgi:hypothetical protein
MKKLTFCGICPRCFGYLNLITGLDFSTNKIKYYRAICYPCNAKSKQIFKTIPLMINYYDGTYHNN